VPGNGPDIRPDLVERQFRACAPDQLWVADTTYCRTFTGWVYAAFVTDVFSRRVVRWQPVLLAVGTLAHEEVQAVALQPPVQGAALIDREGQVDPRILPAELAQDVR
jgi:transposase InsO family protein